MMDLMEEMEVDDLIVSDSYLNGKNKEKAKKLFKDMIDIGVDFKLRNKVLNYLSFDNIYDIFDEPLPENGTSEEEIISWVNEKLIPHSTNFASPYSMAFPDAGNSIISIAGSLLGDFLNQNLINWYPCSPVGTVIEMIVLNWMRQIIGHSPIVKPKSPLEVGGIVTTGGVSSNTIATLIAREKACPDSMKKGVQGNQYVLIVPNGIDHYSSRLSMGWLGMGEGQVIKAPTKDFKYDLEKIEPLINGLYSTGKKVISLVAYAGDSRSMTCDNFLKIRELCDKYNIWFHVDGCHGTQLLFSENLKYKVKGICVADSVTLDPHKVLNIPYVISMLILKDPENLKLIQRPEDIITGEAHSFGQVTPLFGSRAFLSLKFYMLVKHLGMTGLSQMIERRHYMARCLAGKIKTRKHFILVNPNVEINSVIFMYLPERFLDNHYSISRTDIEIINYVNTKIHEQLLADGKVWLHNFSIPDLSNVYNFGCEILLRPLRFMSGNPILEEQHLDNMLDMVENCGKCIKI